MDSPRHPARDSLDDAREASRRGDYGAALESYRHFFEHALDGDPASLYGVRLSYCLAEWARIGRQYPPALAALEERRHEALRRLEATREPEHFHDFECISKYLDVHGEAVERFVSYHTTDPELAKSIARFVWSKLIEAEAWEICAAYLGDLNQRYANALAKFDEAMTVSRANPEFGGADFEKQIQGWYIRDVSELILVLRNTGRDQDGEAIQLRAKQDVVERGYAEIGESICLHVAR